jgi:hypothetical protein
MKVSDFQDGDIVMVSDPRSKNYGKFATVRRAQVFLPRIRLYPVNWGDVGSKMKEYCGFEGEPITRTTYTHHSNVTLIFRNNPNARKPKLT